MKWTSSERPAGIEREFEFSEANFTLLRRYVREHVGIHLPECKRELVYGRVARRLRALGLRDFDAYCDLLVDQRNGEIEHLTNAITTNLTAFFREPHHFVDLGQQLHALLHDSARRRRLRIWSAGCSTGEEAYSIAMVLGEALDGLGPEASSWDARILATDVDSNVLATGAAGIYDLERAQSSVSHTRLKRWFQRGRGPRGGQVRVSSALRDRVSFRRLNLLQEWPLRGPFDFIFCRNVVIYFDKPSQRALFGRFAELLAPGSRLFIGHSESLFKVSERFGLSGKSAYQRLP